MWEEAGGWGWGGQPNPRKRNFLLCKHSFHLLCLLSQTGVNTLESLGLSQSSRFLLSFALPRLSPPFSVALNILSSSVILCPVCIPLSPHLFLLSKCSPPYFPFHTLSRFYLTPLPPLGLFSLVLADVPEHLQNINTTNSKNNQSMFNQTWCAHKYWTTFITRLQYFCPSDPVENFFWSYRIKRGDWKWSSYFWCILHREELSPQRHYLCIPCSFVSVAQFLWPVTSVCVSVSAVYSISADHCLPARHESASATHWACCHVILRKLRAADKHSGEMGRVCVCVSVCIREQWGRRWGKSEGNGKTKERRDVAVCPAEWLCQCAVTWGRVGGCPFTDRWAHTDTQTYVHKHICLRLLDSSLQAFKTIYNPLPPLTWHGPAVSVNADALWAPSSLAIH